MTRSKARRRLCAALGAALAALCLGAPAAQGAFGDPLYVFTPKPPPPPAKPSPPPTGSLYGPCGLAVDSEANFYVADYYHHAVDVFGFNTQDYKGQLAGVDPLGGPCGLALDAADTVYVNNYHRNVTGFGAFPSFGTGSVFPLPEEETADHLPTGIAVDRASELVYVDHRTYIGVYDLAGIPIEELGEEVRIGAGSLQDGYGLAVSEHVDTAGRLYVPDAGTDTVKVYDPEVDAETPVAEIEAPGGGPFTSLRDSAIAIDSQSGVIYLADDNQPAFTERPQATIHSYNKNNAYNGHLKYNVITARPPGIAVDNSAVFTQGRVYVTSGNSSPASVYAYPPAATVFSPPLPPTAPLAVAARGSGAGMVTTSLGSLECRSACSTQIYSGADVTLTATPRSGSDFASWSGACSGTGRCTLTMRDAVSVTATFTAGAQAPAQAVTQDASADAVTLSATPRRHVRQTRRGCRYRRGHHRCHRAGHRHRGRHRRRVSDRR